MLAHQISRRILQSSWTRAGAVWLFSMIGLAESCRPVHADESQVQRGKYLVGIVGCGDCHTPGHFFGKPDLSRALSGSEVGFEVPQLGVFYGSNLTPDNETGLGNWSVAEIVAAFTRGVTPDNRELSAAMPWRGFSAMTAADANSIAEYLKTLKPIKNAVPGPFGPTEKPTSFVMKIVPPSN
ncbi:cytochrome c [Bradyrhizobium sp. 2S1]|uniref:cytochrome c n=1 Tax=Bradyrhizobium sp. 2S1 TaxID=1404429 RepID=UPI00289D81ED|nr:cytochrome c [Bradyrhizobium sp. 2S1]